MKILTYRTREKLSQQELAQKIGVTSAAVCQYETGKRTPSIELLKKIALALNCTVDDLIKDK